jgi:hypothetical protein
MLPDIHTINRNIQDTERLLAYQKDQNTLNVQKLNIKLLLKDTCSL